MKRKLLGHAIKEDRIARGITQKALQEKISALAIDCFVPSNLVANIERGVTRHVDNKNLSLIAEVLGLNPQHYFEYEINPMNLLHEGGRDPDVPENSWFDRSIEFAPEYRQAGISILSFFSEIVRSEFPDQDVRVGILQEGNKVTLRIETPEGSLLKEVEKTLENYGLVIMGGAPIDSLSSNQELIRNLKTKLEVTNLELKLRKEMHLDQKQQYEKRMVSLEDQVRNLHGMIGSNLAHYTEFSEIIKSVIQDDKTINSLQSTLKIIDRIVVANYSDLSASDLKNALNKMEEKSPGLVQRLLITMESIPASVMANMASSWVHSLITSLPK